MNQNIRNCLTKKNNLGSHNIPDDLCFSGSNYQWIKNYYIFRLLHCYHVMKKSRLYVAIEPIV